DAVRWRRGGRIANGHQHGAPFDDIEVDVHADSLEVLLHEFIHWDWHHRTGTRCGNHDLCLDRLIGTIAGLLSAGPSHDQGHRCNGSPACRRSDAPADTVRTPVWPCHSAFCTCPRDPPRNSTPGERAHREMANSPCSSIRTGKCADTAKG